MRENDGERRAIDTTKIISWWTSRSVGVGTGRHPRSLYFFFSSRRRHTRSLRDWSSDVCSSDLVSVARQHHADHAVGLLTGRGAKQHVDRGAVAVLTRADGQRHLSVGDHEVSIRRRSEERRVGKEGRSRRPAEHKEERLRDGRNG